MSPELESYLSADNALAGQIASLQRELKGAERDCQSALDRQRANSSWREFVVLLLIMALLLNSLAIHMGAQLGWWDTNELVTGIDQWLTTLNTYESETAPLVYGAHALGWFCETLLYIFFALPYQLLALVEELISMVAPVASPYLPYAEGVVLGVVALNILKGCPLFRGIPNKEVSRIKKRIRQIEQRIKATEAERSKLPADKVMAARQAEMEERRQREAEERERQLQREAEERERQLQREAEERERLAEATVKRRVKELYDQVHDVPETFFEEPDILLLGENADDESKLAEILRTFCPDDRRIFGSGQMDQASERLRNNHNVAVVLLVSDDRGKEQLCWFLSTDFMTSEAVVLRVTNLMWANEEGIPPRVEKFVDEYSGVRGLELSVSQLDINALESIYTYPMEAAIFGDSGNLLARPEAQRRFFRYRSAAKSAREGWHIEGDTLVLDGHLSTVDGRTPWAGRSLLVRRIEARDGASISEYDAYRTSFFPNRRMEGLFEGHPYLGSADLQKLRVGSVRFDELLNAFDTCPVLDEVYIPDNAQLMTGLWKNGYERAAAGCWRPSFLIED